jgi:hypothetical protein
MDLELTPRHVFYSERPQNKRISRWLLCSCAMVPSIDSDTTMLTTKHSIPKHLWHANQPYTRPEHDRQPNLSTTILHTQKALDLPPKICYSTDFPPKKTTFPDELACLPQTQNSQCLRIKVCHQRRSSTQLLRIATTNHKPLIRTLDLCPAAESIDLVSAVAFAAEFKSVWKQNRQQRDPIHTTRSPTKCLGKR